MLQHTFMEAPGRVLTVSSLQPDPETQSSQNTPEVWREEEREGGGEERGEGRKEREGREERREREEREERRERERKGERAEGVEREREES